MLKSHLNSKTKKSLAALPIVVCSWSAADLVSGAADLVSGAANLSITAFANVQSGQGQSSSLPSAQKTPQGASRIAKPDVSVALRLDALYSSVNDSGALANENWGFDVSHAHLFVSGLMSSSVTYFLDLDLAPAFSGYDKAQNFTRGERGELLPFIAELWVERQVSLFTFKAGRMWLRSGAFENDSSVSDIYQYSRLTEMTLANYGTGFEFGFVPGGQQFYAQIMESALKANTQGHPEFAYGVSWYGSFANGMFRPLATAFAQPLYKASGGGDAEGKLNLARKGWLLQGGIGTQFNFARSALSLEYGHMRSENGFQDAVQESNGAREQGRFLGFAAEEGLTTMQNVVVLYEHHFKTLAPFAKVSYDWLAAAENVDANSVGASVGVEYYPMGSQYRTHLVYTNRIENLPSKVESLSTRVLFGMNFKL